VEKLAGKQTRNIGEACGWRERKRARCRATNAKEEARFLRGGWIDPTARSTLAARLTQPALAASREILCAYVSRADTVTYRPIVNNAQVSWTTRECIGEILL